MSIIINKANAAKLAKLFADANGRATLRTIDESDLPEIINGADAAMKSTLLPMSAWVGAMIEYRMAIDLPNSYKYAPDYTYVSLVRRASGWAVEHAERLAGNNKQTERYSIALTESQATAAVERFTSRFIVQFIDDE